MYFYFLIIPSLVVLALVCFDLFRIKKHDKVLYRFCQIRRESMAFLRKKGFSLSEHDYTVLKEMLDGLDITIHNYNACKCKVFNYRNFTSKLAELKIEASKFKHKKSKTHEVVKLTNSFNHAMIYAFLSYTPFLRSQWFFKLLLMLFRILIVLGVKRITTLADDLLWLNKQKFNNHSNELKHA